MTIKKHKYNMYTYLVNKAVKHIFFKFTIDVVILIKAFYIQICYSNTPYCRISILLLYFPEIFTHSHTLISSALEVGNQKYNKRTKGKYEIYDPGIFYGRNAHNKKGLSDYVNVKVIRNGGYFSFLLLFICNQKNQMISLTNRKKNICIIFFRYTFIRIRSLYV